jgi:hypothetical protein
MGCALKVTCDSGLRHLGRWTSSGWPDHFIRNDNETAGMAFVGTPIWKQKGGRHRPWWHVFSCGWTVWNPFQANNRRPGGQKFDISYLFPTDPIRHASASCMSAFIVRNPLGYWIGMKVEYPYISLHVCLEGHAAFVPKPQILRDASPFNAPGALLTPGAASDSREKS